MQAAPFLEEDPSPAAVYRPEDRSGWRLGQMYGRSPIMQRLFSQMRHTARHLRVATIEGENGTGKLLAARTLHQFGPNPESPFIPCPANQFFEAWRVTVPVSSGKFEFSNHSTLRRSCGGTLVLTRIDELSPTHQASLLDLLQWIDHQHIVRALDSIPRQVLCLSAHPLRRLALAASLRSDLATRLTAIRFGMPALRERREDIALLADYFAQRFADTHGKPMHGLGPMTLPRLVQHSWPRNVRELESLIDAAALSCEGQWIRPIDLPAFTTPVDLAAAPPATSSSAAPDDPNLDRAILRHIHGVLARVEGNKLRAAKMLGISRSTLYRLLESAPDSISAMASSRVASPETIARLP